MNEIIQSLIQFWLFDFHVGDVGEQKRKYSSKRTRDFTSFAWRLCVKQTRKKRGEEKRESR